MNLIKHPIGQKKCQFVQEENDLQLFVITIFCQSIDIILCVWQERIGEYHLNSEKLGFNMDQGPQARGLY